MTVAAEKYLLRLSIIVDYVRISKRLSDNIRKTKRAVSVKISSHDASFTSKHFKFHFPCKTYSLVSDDFCNLSATGQMVKMLKI